MFRVLPLAFLLLLVATASPCALAAPPPSQVDVLVYGGTPAGIAAALAAAKDGCRTMLVEPTPRLGGLVTSGLSHTDFHSFESLSGAFLEFARRVEGYYSENYGKQSQQVRDSFHGTFGEPKVNLHIFRRMLAEQSLLTVATRHTLVRQELPVANRRISQVHFRSAEGQELIVTAAIVIDATYEGDLMAAAGVPFSVGRESRKEFNESLAPEEADKQLQAYNFRFIMTRDPVNRVTPIAPDGYDRDDFAAIVPILTAGKIRKVFDYPRECLFKAQTPPLPNGKYDINDVSQGVVRLSLPGQNLEWPTGDAKIRQQIFQTHLYDQVGLLYFLQNDDDVPEKLREEARNWGWCRDEFEESGHLPPQLYVREARRMKGAYLFTQHDSEPSPGDARAWLRPNAIAMGDYGNNCHGTAHDGPRFGGKHTGEFYNPVPPYQIPYGVLVPREVDNLLVPGAASSTHVGFCALRLEPIWMSLGQAAGHAAAIAVKSNVPVQRVPVDALQDRLHAAGSATVYVSDVLFGSPDFAAVQWWGTHGGLHGLEPIPANNRPRGKTLHGQYSEAAPGHAAQLDKPLTPELGRKWIQLADRLGAPAANLPANDGRLTRGQFIHAAYQASRRPTK